MIHRLKTREALRVAAAKWVLANDLGNIFYEGGEQRRRFIDEYELPKLRERLFATYVDDGENITLVFDSRICLNEYESVIGVQTSLTILRYVRVLYDDNGNIYSYVTLGYRYY